MSKPNIQNVTTTQTFQNWFDKTNEMVNIFRDSAITASVSGDTTIGDASLTGEFGANTIVAYPSLHADEFIATTAGGTIDVGSPINITGTTDEVVATFTFGGSGGRVRFTEGSNSWDAGMNNVSDLDFAIGYNGTDLFKLSPTGVLTVDSIVAETGISVVGGDITVDNASVTQQLTANNATIQSLTSDDIRGKFTGDIYHPAGNKIFENGGPAANVPATFTGNVNGTVSSLTNHKTTNLTEGTNLYFTRLRVRETLTQGTGVGITVDPNDATKTVISIGQPVNITSNVRFTSVETTGDIEAGGTVTATSFIGDGSQLSGIKAPLVKGFITFNGATGQVIASDGLALVKTATGSYTININAGIRKSDSNYGVVIGNVDDKRTSASSTPSTGANKLSNYNAWLDTRATNSFNIKATRNTNSYAHFGGNDHNTGSLFGISLVDPDYITVLLVY